MDIEMEPQFTAVEDSFLKVVDASNICFVEGSDKIAMCSRCDSRINVEALNKKRGRDYEGQEGICPICQDTERDGDTHIPRPKMRFDVTGPYGGRSWAYESQEQHNSRVRAEHDAKEEKLNNMLRKIGKRPRVQKSAKPHLFNKLTFRPLFKQPEHSVSILDFKEAVSKLLPKREEIEQTQEKGDVNYLVRISWLSSHDEWQENSDMDEY